MPKLFPDPLTHSRPAFTLLELLVVIAIIALLTSILLPALAATRDAGRASVCASNLRQLAVALDLYADDHADRYAPAASDALANLSRWHGTRESAAAAFTPRRGPITPYIHADPLALEQGEALRTCPSFAGVLLTLRDAGAGFERGCGGYGYNAAFVGVDRAPERFLPTAPGAPTRGVSNVRTDRSGSLRSRFQTPSATLAFADAAFADQSPAGDLIEYSFLEPRFHPHLALPARLDPSTHFRHGTRAGSAARSGRAAIAWLDAHVSMESLGFSWSSGLYIPAPSDQDIGWAGSVDDNALYDYR